MLPQRLPSFDGLPQVLRVWLKLTLYNGLGDLLAHSFSSVQSIVYRLVDFARHFLSFAIGQVTTNIVDFGHKASLLSEHCLVLGQHLVSSVSQVNGTSNLSAASFFGKATIRS